MQGVRDLGFQRRVESVNDGTELPIRSALVDRLLGENPPVVRPPVCAGDLESFVQSDEEIAEVAGALARDEDPGTRDGRLLLLLLVVQQ